MYQVLARKWRPQNFDDLVGQSHVTRTLANAIASDRLAHAYIFAGLRGTGKTTVARILAKCLNCEGGPTNKPCDGCASCEEITHSRSMDVLEIDAASRTKVEQTRELLEMVSYAPVRDRRKILIIDEAHMLSKASFNALLKTLEEPPPNVMFILATTEVQKVLPTILSRCQIFEFRRVGVREVAEHMTKICTAEKVEISTAALERVARAGEGSVRDSLSVLDRVLAFCGHQVSDDDVLRLLGGVRAEVLTGLISALARRDAAAMLGVFDGVVDEGHDLLHFWNELLAALRDLLILEAMPGRDELLARSPEEGARLRDAAAGLTREDLTRVFQILADLEFSLKSSGQPRFIFEAALIRIAGLGAVRPIEELLQDLGGEPQTLAPRKPPAQKKSLAAVAAVDPPAASAVHETAETGDPATLPATVVSGAPVARLIAAVVEAKPILGTMLEQARRVELVDGQLRVGFAPGQEHLLRPLSRPETAKLLEQHAERIAGAPVKIRVAIEKSGTPVASGAAAPAAQPAATPRKPESAEPVATSPEPAPPASSPASAATTAGGEGLLETARQEPGVQKLLREFGAQVVTIKPFAETPGLRQTGRGKSRTVEDLG